MWKAGRIAAAPLHWRNGFTAPNEALRLPHPNALVLVPDRVPAVVSLVAQLATARRAG